MMKVGLPTWPLRATQIRTPNMVFGGTRNTDNASPSSAGNSPDKDNKPNNIPETPCRALTVYDPTVVLGPKVEAALQAAQQQQHPFIRRGRLAAVLEQAERLGDWHYLKNQVTLAVADNLLNNPYHPNERADETDHRLRRALVLYRGIKSQLLKTSTKGLDDNLRPLTTRVLLSMGDTHFALGEWDEAEELYRGVVAVSPNKKRLAPGNPPSLQVGEAYLGLSKIAKQDTRLEEALEYSEQSVAVFRAHPVGWGRVRALNQYHDILHVLGDTQQAELIEIEIKQARKSLKSASSN